MQARRRTVQGGPSMVVRQVLDQRGSAGRRARAGPRGGARRGRGRRGRGSRPRAGRRGGRGERLDGAPGRAPRARRSAARSRPPAARSPARRDRSRAPRTAVPRSSPKFRSWSRASKWIGAPVVAASARAVITARSRSLERMRATPAPARRSASRRACSSAALRERHVGRLQDAPRVVRRLAVADQVDRVRGAHGARQRSSRATRSAIRSIAGSSSTPARAHSRATWTTVPAASSSRRPLKHSGQRPDE